jgi:aminoglycoside phosphotransferase (APT) family kinase protein
MDLTLGPVLVVATRGLDGSTASVGPVNRVRDGVEGIDVAGITAWFGDHVPAVSPPLDVELIAGGHSNLTYTVTDVRGERWVLRRPPLGHVLATAHDMGREHRIIAALQDTDVPVAPVVGLCNDESVTGAPFYVMGFVDGQVARDPEAAALLSGDARARAGRALVDVLARIHAVDPDSVGLGDLGRREDYVGRQLRRWHAQWLQSKTRELPLVDEVHDALAARVPEQGPATIVHGDYRLDNCILDGHGDVLAVLDWELCTLGDPLADIGLLLVYWTEPDDPRPALLDPPTTIPGFSSREEIAAGYAERSGRDLAGIDYYMAFGFWKLACILEGVYERYRAGVMREHEGWEEFADRVVWLAESAHDALARLP